MKEIALVACSKTKAPRASLAATLYTSPLFRKSLLASLSESSGAYVLSAKHGVLDLGDHVRPYEKTLKNMRAVEKREWAGMVVEQLSKILRPRDVVTAYCGEEYIAPLRSRIAQLGCKLREPLHGQSLGRRLQTLRAVNEEEALRKATKQFGLLMRRLWLQQEKGRRLSDCSGRTGWPDRGVYFILDSRPPRSSRAMPRIVRVGTHAVSSGSQTSLWHRLSTHRGVENGGGSHRSSIFRLHVGRALMNSKRARTWPSSWGEGQAAPLATRQREARFENLVSRRIGQLRVVWLDVGDEAGPNSDRAYLERNAIGLLSRFNLLSPNTVGSWLGAFSPDWRIAASGLWNLNHLFLRPDPSFLEVLEEYVDSTERGVSLKRSIAPKAESRSRVRSASQLDLFGEGENDGRRVSETSG